MEKKFRRQFSLKNFIKIKKEKKQYKNISLSTPSRDVNIKKERENNN